MSQNISNHVKTLAAPNTINDRRGLILIVEDHDDTRTLYQFILESRNFSVAVASDGEQAVKLAKETKPNLILMDSNLPGMDGVMAAHEIRQHRSGRHVPIIFLSGDAQPVSQIKAINAGADEYLVKPINLDDLTTAIERQLKKRARRGPRFASN
jgi:DNA-binding response OmpR family regulator